MPTDVEIEEWEAALDRLNKAHAHLKEHLGKPSEPAARRDYENAKKAYEEAATKLG